MQCTHHVFQKLTEHISTDLYRHMLQSLSAHAAMKDPTNTTNNYSYITYHPISKPIIIKNSLGHSCTIMLPSCRSMQWAQDINSRSEHKISIHAWTSNCCSKTQHTGSRQNQEPCTEVPWWWNQVLGWKTATGGYHTFFCTTVLNNALNHNLHSSFNTKTIIQYLKQQTGHNILLLLVL